MSKRVTKGKPVMGRGKGKKAKQVVQEESGGSSSEDENLMGDDPNNMGIDILHLPPEELDKNVTKTLTFENPQAPSNIAQFS